jgi:pectinesterase
MCFAKGFLMEQKNRKKERREGTIALFGLPIVVAMVVASWLTWHTFSPTKAAKAAAAYTTKTLVVAQDGSGQYSTVQAAVNAVPANNTVRTIIYIKDGTYNEVVTVPANKPFITFAGQDENKTIISYNNYSGKAMPGGGTYNTATSASVFIEAPDFLATNLTIQNTAGDVGQAVAADVEGDRANFYKVRFLGWQDTLLAWQGRQYYNNVYVQGRTDYVFGDATAYFNDSEFYNLKGWNITAQYRQNGSETTGFVFSNCVIKGTPANSTTLGRPWGPYARVVFLNTSMDSSIESVGWQNWTSTSTNYLNSYFAEYNSSGAGANPNARVSWSHQLSSSQAAAYSVNSFLNQDGWLNTSESFLNWLLANYP